MTILPVRSPVGLFETVNRLATLVVGRRPEWTTQPTLTAPPDAPTAGVPLLDRARCLVSVALREAPARRTARVRITAADAATTYTITVDGHAVPITGESDVEDVASALKTALEADVDVAALVTVSIESTGGVADTLVLRGISADDYTITAAAASGTGTLTLVADATTVTVRVWGLARGAGAPAWTMLRGGDWGELDARGVIERLDCAGLERVAVQLVDADGAVTVAIGPCAEEG